MLRVTAANVAQARTIKPLYAAPGQATPYACTLESAWGRLVDIYPGMVMTKLDGENVTLFGGAGGTAANHKVFGLSAMFVAPVLGIDELTPTGTNNFAVWVGGNQGVFEVDAPAFATTASWSVAVAGEKIPLRVTIGAHASGIGKLTPEASGATVSVEIAAYLIKVVSTTQIIVSLEHSA